MAISKHTKLLLYSGRIETVANIKEGDLLMGRDSTPRKVIRLKEVVSPEVYQIQPRQKRGPSIILSHDQIILLSKAQYLNKPYVRNISSGKPIIKDRYPSWGNQIQVRVEDILDKSYEGFWKKFKLTKVAVDFNDDHRKTQEAAPKLDAYFIGLWLGDGTSSRPEITSMDAEIVARLEILSKKWNTKIQVTPKKDNQSSTYALTVPHAKGLPNKGRNQILNALRDYNLINNKHIPNQYLFGTRQERLEILAGVLDTDGYTKGNVTSIIQKNEKLAYQLQFLANTLGFRSNVVKKRKHIRKRNFVGDYFDVKISGSIDQIPAVLFRKQANNLSKRYNRKEIGYDILPLPSSSSDLIQIEVSADGIFLLEDCTMIGGNQEKVRKAGIRNEQKLDQRWGKMYGEVKAYVKKNNTLPTQTDKRAKQLFNWVSNQRGNLSKNKGSEMRIRLLNNIGITHDILTKNFYRMMEILKEYREQYPNRWPRYKEEYPEGNSLGEWCRTIRKSYRKGKLSQNRKEQLDLMNFEWNVIGDQFARKPKLFSMFLEENNRLPKRKQEYKGALLGNWYFRNKNREEVKQEVNKKIE